MTTAGWPYSNDIQPLKGCIPWLVELIDCGWTVQLITLLYAGKYMTSTLRCYLIACRFLLKTRA